ncbi:MAG: AmmeMemoRadiSam system protein B [Elusimicrobiota bacterium]|nr:AmmeMemoRadiSam system protein B [Elusimicrobiota bacterium]
MIRKAICAGTWYPKEKEEVAKYLQSIPSSEKQSAIGCVCPHAGWMYSGKVAGKVYSKLNPYETYILIGPNHTGFGMQASIFSEGSWQLPLGKIDIDEELSKEIIKNSEFLQSDTEAHIREHSLEVQIPFIQYISPNAKIIPITIMSDEFEVAKDISNAISQAIKKQTKKILIVASTDMTHYEQHEYAKKQDMQAIDRIINLDAEGLLNVVRDRGISMCGVSPTAIVILACKNLGAKKAELVQYSTSGDITGDYDAVVGYAGLIIR